MTDPMPRAFILTRQSITAEKDVSLDVQEERCRAYCHERGYAVVSVSREESTKGWQDDREAIAIALDRAQARSYDILVAWDTSRVARSVRILEQLLHDLDQHGARFESVSEPWVGTPFVRQVLAAVAEEQTRTISRNVSAAKAAVARRGQWHGGSAPLGYKLVKLGDAPSVLVPDEREGPLVQEAFRRVASGESIGSVCRDFRARGHLARRSTKWTTDVLTDAIRNPVYVGDLRYHGAIVATDSHPPLVARDVWDLANRMLARRSTVRRHEGKPSHWLEGRVQHACGFRMYLQVNPHRSTLTGWQAGYVCASHYAAGRERYDACPEPRPRISAAKAGWCARRCLVADLESLRDLPSAIAAAEHAAGGNAVANERQRLIERRNAADRRYERVRDAWADGDEPLEWLEQQRERRGAIYTEVDEQLAALPAAPDPEQYRRAADSLAHLSDLIDSLTGAELVPVIAQLGNVVISESTVAIAYYPEYRDFIPVPHAEPIPAGLPRSVTATCP